MSVVGTKGESFPVSILENVEVESETYVGLNDLLLVPEAEYNLLGRDLIIKMGLKLIGENGKVQLYALTKDEGDIDPRVWYKEGELGKLEMEPLMVEITESQKPIKQYPNPLEGRKGLKPVIERLLQGRSLKHMSHHNMPILPIKKADGTYHLVQDLRAVN